MAVKVTSKRRRYQHLIAAAMIVKGTGGRNVRVMNDWRPASTPSASDEIDLPAPTIPFDRGR